MRLVRVRARVRARVRVRVRVRVSPNLAEPDDQRVARAAFAVELHAWLGRGPGSG